MQLFGKIFLFRKEITLGSRDHFWQLILLANLSEHFISMYGWKPQSLPPLRVLFLPSALILCLWRANPNLGLVTHITLFFWRSTSHLSGSFSLMGEPIKVRKKLVSELCRTLNYWSKVKQTTPTAPSSFPDLLKSSPTHILLKPLPWKISCCILFVVLICPQ